MKFKLRTSGYFYEPDEAAALRKHGFEFERGDRNRLTPVNTPGIEFNTLEELIAFSKEVEHPLIVTDGEIEIYDDWRE